MGAVVTMRRCRRLQNFSAGRNSPSEGQKIFLSRSVIDFGLPSARTDAVEVKGGDFHVQGLSENELRVFFFKKKVVLCSRSVPALLACGTFWRGISSCPGAKMELIISQEMLLFLQAARYGFCSVPRSLGLLRNNRNVRLALLDTQKKFISSFLCSSDG